MKKKYKYRMSNFFSRKYREYIKYKVPDYSIDNLNFVKYVIYIP